MQKIKSIQIQNLHNNGKLYEVGKNGVFEILDKTLEYTNSIYTLYVIRNKEGKNIAIIENCPVLVECDVPENNKIKDLELIEESKKEIFNFKSSLIKLGVNESIVSDWLKVRSKKKAANTETSFKALQKQIELSGKTANECITLAVENSWKGFKAEWIAKNNDQKNETENLKSW